MRLSWLGTTLGLCAALSAPARAAQCSAQSAAHTTALVELYTSEGCDSCPPADRWLSSLRGRGYAATQLVPMALHVDYWDYIGWKDPFAKAAFSARQRKLAQVHRARVVYTPQVVLQGEDFRDWRGAGFDAAVARINATPAVARIALQLETSARDALRVEVRSELAASEVAPRAQLYLAAYENRLASEVSAGENRGKTLTHDFVVLEWIGPIAFGSDGRLAERRALPLLPGAVARNSGVAAFVQDRSGARVLQALMLPAC